MRSVSRTTAIPLTQEELTSMTHKSSWIGLILALLLCCLCGCQGKGSPQQQLEALVEAGFIDGGAFQDGRLTMTVDDTLTLTASLSSQEITVEAASSGPAVEVAVEGNTLTLTAMEAGDANISITLSMPGLHPVTWTGHVSVRLHTQELSAVLTPVPDDLLPEDPPSQADGFTDGARTCSYEGGVLTLQAGTTAALDLIGEEGTAFLLQGSEGECVDASLHNGLLLVTAREPGEAALVVTGEKEKYEPAGLDILVEAQLPPVTFQLEAMGLDPAAPDLEVGEHAEIAVILHPEDALLSLDLKGDAADATLTGHQLFLAGVTPGESLVTLRASREGYEDAEIALPVQVSGARAQLSLSCAKLEINDIVPLLQGEEATVTALTGAGGILSYDAPDGAVEISQEGANFTVRALAPGRVKVIFTAREEGKADRARALTFVVTQPQIFLETDQALNLTPGSTASIPYTLEPADAQIAVSCDGALAEASCQDGVLTVRSLKAGRSVITLTASKEGYAPRTVSLSLTAAPLPVSLELSRASLNGTPGEELRLRYTVDPVDAAVSVRISDPSIAQVDCAGGTLTVRPLVSGAATITITAGAEGRSPATRTVSLSVGDEVQGPADLSAYADAVFRLVNQERANAGLDPLERTPELDAGAQVRAEEIPTTFSHTRPNGESFYTVYGVEQNLYFGENIAYGYRGPQDVMQGWMNSAGHRANILNSSYVGIGIGIYQSGDTLYWVQNFRNDRPLPDDPPSGNVLESSSESDSEEAFMTP